MSIYSLVFFFFFVFVFFFRTLLCFISEKPIRSATMSTDTTTTLSTIMLPIQTGLCDVFA